MGQFADGTVEHVEMFGLTMDLASCRVCRELLERNLRNYECIEASIKDNRDRVEFRGVFADEVARLRAALKTVDQRLDPTLGVENEETDQCSG